MCPEGATERSIQLAMLAPKRLDIGWDDLAFALAACAASSRRAEAWRSSAERAFGGDRPALVALSVRSGLVATLTALDLPRGSEVIMSAINIPEMARVIEAFGLVVVPIDVDEATLAPSLEAFERARTPRTRVLLLAHLFGGLAPVAALIAAARERGLVVIEDMAQAYAAETANTEAAAGAGAIADASRGDPQSDAVFFSFGPIKTMTALGGAVVTYRDRSLRDAAAAIEATWPVQSTRGFASRAARSTVLKFVGMPACYRLFVEGCRAFGVDHEAVTRRGVRGFGEGDLLKSLSVRPSPPLLGLLARRLRRARRNRPSVTRRVRDVTRLLELVPQLRRPGSAARRQTHWLLPMLSREPERVVRHLRERGFDATCGASTLEAIEPTERRPAPATAVSIMREIVYVPIDGGLPLRVIHRLAAALRDIVD